MHAGNVLPDAPRHLRLLFDGFRSEHRLSYVSVIAVNVKPGQLNQLISGLKSIFLAVKTSLLGYQKDSQKDHEGSDSLGRAEAFVEEIVIGDRDKNQGD